MAERVNRAIELLAAGQPIYYVSTDRLGYEAGRELAGTFADYISADLEHHPLDMPGLAELMRGLADAGPTRSAHRTPAVIVTLPMDGSSEEIIWANSWIIKQSLAAGVHGLLLCHAESASAVRAFVEASRYPFQRAGVGAGLAEGRRGQGGQIMAAPIWGLDVDEYLQRADPWPLNPAGELMLGLKIENRRALANAEETLAVPGLSFAEWGPGDMGMSLGFPNNHDEPFPPEMWAARNRVKALCDRYGLAFLEGVASGRLESRLDEGVKVVNPLGLAEVADRGRRYTGRLLPW